MAFGQVDHAEDFLIEGAKPNAQVIGGYSRGGKAGALADALRQCTAGAVQDFFEAGLANAGRGDFVVGAKSHIAHIDLRLGGIAR